MSIQTSVYIDGHWTTRTVDIHHLLVQNRENPQQQKERSTLDAPKQPSPLGVLTQTVIRSPVIKWIIPARIRHEDKNDVIFIYDNYIEIKQITQHGDGHMQNIAVKTDFDSAIRAAKIFGKPRKYYIYVGDYNKKVGETMIQPQVPPQIPPQILVMVLESNKIVFLFAFHDAPGHLEFISYQRPLPSPQFGSERLCEHIAVDPKSRAMAIATLEGSFTVYALTSMDEIKEHVEVAGRMLGDNFMPVKEERHINVDGVIISMEFLHPPEADLEENHVILLLIISKNGKSRIFCYEWDCSTSLETIALKGPGQGLHQDEQLPLLLVPLTKSTAFMLVSENRITVYRDILTGRAKSHFLILSNQERPEEPGSSRRLPIWTQWARVMRTEEHTKKQDNIYLCREDGVVHFLEIKDKVGQMLDVTHRAGFLKVNIDTSFATLDMGVDMGRKMDVDMGFTETRYESGKRNSADILVAGGDLSDGGRWSFEARGVANNIDVIPNWTPLMDLTAVEGTRTNKAAFGHAGSISSAVQGQTRFFASTGRGSTHGTITEIRYGIEAIKKNTLNELHELPGIDITQIWVLTGFNRGIFVLLSYPSHTSLLQIYGADEPPDEMDSADYEIDEDITTIAAGMSAEGLIVQVTRNSVRATMPKAEVESLHWQEKILAACVRKDNDNDAQIALLMALQNDNGVHLHLGCLGTEDGTIFCRSIARSIPLDFEPVSISLECIDDESIIIVGSAASTLHVFRLDPRSGLVPVFEYTFDGQFAICDSIALLTMQSDSSSEYLVLCGLRSGAVEVLGLNSGSNDRSLSFYERIQIGSTTATVATDKIRISRAVVVCEQKIHCLEYSFNLYGKAQVPAKLNSIWLTDPDLHGFQQGGISAVAQVKSGLDPALFLCVEGSKIHVACISPASEPCMVPRRIHVHGTPTRVVYSQRLKKLIVLYYQTIVRSFIQKTESRIRSDFRGLQYKIAIIDPDAEYFSPDPNDDDFLQSKFDGKPGERFLGVMEWFPKSGEDVYHMLVVHTLLEKPIISESKGRILFFSISENGNLTLKWQDAKGSPVYALAPYGPSSLLYSCGKDLYLQTRELTTKSAGSSVKMQRPFKYGLGTRGLHISTNESLIYVTTDQNGLLIFKSEGNTLVPYLSDEKAREGLYHLAIPEKPLIIASQRTSSIAGIWQSPEPTVDNSTSTIFEATLSGSITRFRQIPRPPWQTDLHAKALGQPSPAASPSKPTQSPAPTWSDPIIGSTTNGTLLQLEILDEPSWQLLRLIQNMAARDPVICPFADPFNPLLRTTTTIPLDPSPAPKGNLHVNGDILRRILDRGAESLLRNMLERDAALPPPPTMTTTADRRGGGGEGADADADPEIVAAARQGPFAELTTALGIRWRDGDELVAQVVRWLRFRLQIAL